VLQKQDIGCLFSPEIGRSSVLGVIFIIVSSCKGSFCTVKDDDILTFSVAIIGASSYLIGLKI
ncbi:hypothetical protein, partial [Candidatus Regiella insecticola]|uniref:hypothetical protein n=1 Tax=Candidatus Regiella insecticola TaxID=138073 RepID=UPI001ED8E0B1